MAPVSFRNARMGTAQPEGLDSPASPSGLCYLLEKHRSGPPPGRGRRLPSRSRRHWLMSDEIRIVIADDHPIVRKGLREVIEDEADLTVAGGAGDGEAALVLIQKLQPAIAILDLRMPRLDGFAVAREVRKRRLPLEIIFLTMHNEVDLLHE